MTKKVIRNLIYRVPWIIPTLTPLRKTWYINEHRKAGISEAYKNVLKVGSTPSQSFKNLIETAKRTGFVQGVCECVAAIGDNITMGKKLLTEMNVNRDIAKKFANPETFKTLEQGIFAQKQEQKLEQTQGVRR